MTEIEIAKSKNVFTKREKFILSSSGSIIATLFFPKKNIFTSGRMAGELARRPRFLPLRIRLRRDGGPRLSTI